MVIDAKHMFLARMAHTLVEQLHQHGRLAMARRLAAMQLSKQDSYLVTKIVATVQSS